MIKRLQVGEPPVGEICVGPSGKNKRRQVGVPPVGVTSVWIGPSGLIKPESPRLVGQVSGFGQEACTSGSRSVRPLSVGQATAVC